MFEPPADDPPIPPRRDLADAILELTRAWEVRGSKPDTPIATELADLLESAAAIARSLLATPWAAVCVQEAHVLATALHSRVSGSIPSLAPPLSDASWGGDVPSEATRFALIRRDLLGQIGPGWVGPVWVVPFGLQQGGRGWLALPGELGAALPTDALAFAAHLGLVVAQGLLAQDVRSTRTMYRTLVEQLPATIYYRSLDTPGAPSFVSPQMLGLTGFAAEEWARDPALWSQRLHPEDRLWVLPDQAAFSPQDMTGPIRKEYRIIHRDGRTVWIENTALAVRDEAGQARFLMGVLFDITERKRLEASLREAQKLEAIGKLAGGVAHDFNNLLSVILGWVGDLKARVATEDANWQPLDEIERAGQRARELTSKLLAFGRRQMLDLEPTRLDRLVAGLESTMNKLVGDRVTLDLRLADVEVVRADAGQIEQVLLNLVANARDAMLAHGRIEVSVFPARRELAGAEREVVCVAVRDEGAGLEEVTRGRIFDPYFTTKDRTRNTGLGLSTALGIVQQCGGRIEVQSEPGRGAVFTVVLPVVQDLTGQAMAALRSPTVPRSATPRAIVVSEADDQIRRMLVMLLGRLGHRALEAKDAATTLRLIVGDDAPDVVFCDAVGPAGMGIALATDLRRRAPELPLILLSAAADGTVVGQADVLGAHILRKPFTLKSLVAVLDEAMKGVAPAARAVET